MDATYGTHVFYGAAWSRISYADALAGAKTELMKVVTGTKWIRGSCRAPAANTPQSLNRAAAAPMPTAQ